MDVSSTLMLALHILHMLTESYYYHWGYTCFDNARIESFNGVFKTEALYAMLGKNKVKTHQYPVKLLTEKTERFISYYITWT